MRHILIVTELRPVTPLPVLLVGLRQGHPGKTMNPCIKVPFKLYLHEVVPHDRKYDSIILFPTAHHGATCVYRSPLET